MSEIKHTPGPWEFCGRTNLPGHPFAVAAGPWTFYASLEANARLICAAPELLEALKAVGEFFDTWQIVRGPAEDALFEQIDAAIAKAVGQ